MINSADWLAWGFPLTALGVGILGYAYSRFLVFQFERKYGNRDDQGRPLKSQR
jgi:hypothetical protein